MITRVQKWGNSQGLRLSKSLLADVAIAVGDEVEVAVHEGMLLVKPVRRVRGGVSLRALIRRIPKGDRAAELDWGPPVGKEVW